MTPEFLPLDAAATLIWLFPGDNADDDDFTWDWVASPPDQNPQAFWTLREAIEFANNADCYHGKGAWIKVGERILNPVDVDQVYRDMKAARTG
jgi:hypothetical protein